jgi:hypothetical protein
MKSNSEEQKGFNLKDGDIAYIVDGHDWEIYISQVRITGLCDPTGEEGGLGYTAVYTQPKRAKNKSFDGIHTCNMCLYPRLREARRQAQMENKKLIEKLKDEQRRLSHAIHYTSFYLKYPHLLYVDGTHSEDQ